MIIIRIIARVFSVLLIALIAAYALTGGFPEFAEFQGSESTELILLLVALAGLILAWFKERIGGLIAFVAMGGFHFLEFDNDHLFLSWPFELVVVDALLFLVASRQKNKSFSHT